MISFIRKLYNSPRHLREVFESTEGYRESLRAFEQAQEALSSELTPGQVAALEHVLEVCSDVTNYESDDAFRVGFCVGARLMLEVMAFDEM